MKRSFVYADDKSNKFWTIELAGSEFTVSYGRLGANPQTLHKLFDSEEKCRIEAEKLIAEKVKKGYVEESEENFTATSRSVVAASDEGEKKIKAAKPVRKVKLNIDTESEAESAVDTGDVRENVTLYFRMGGSDKVYHAELLPAADGTGYVVNASWGRRGSTLQTATKTAKPLPLDKARAIYGKLVSEKTAKGYSPGEDGTLFVGTDNAGRVSGLLPQLLNVIDAETLEKLIEDASYCAQPKHDGERRMIKESQMGVNRKGLTVSLPEHMVATLAASVRGVADLDGEMEGDYYTVFDMLSLDGNDLRKLGYAERFATLCKHVVPTDSRLSVVETAFTADEKRSLFNCLQETNQEGIVFKRVDAPYTHGRPNSGGTQLKYKFCASATVRVLAQNEGKRSVVMGVTDEKGECREVGSVTIPANHSIPEVGQIVEVRYLYAYPQGSLYQPTYAGVRPDMDMDDCVESQLKYKAAGKE